MKYEVRCECGKAYPVSTADAGVSFPCACGAEVVVPAAPRFASGSRGKPGGSPLWGLQAGFMSGALPGPAVCACCRRETIRQVRVAIDCEKGCIGDAPAIVGQVASGCFKLCGTMVVTGIFIFSRDLIESPSKASGLRVTVPVFVCESWRRVRYYGTEHSRGANFGALRPEEYAALLYRYPDAAVSRVP